MHAHMLTFLHHVIPLHRIISRDCHRLIVKPIERMTAVIRKLAGTICLLSANESEESMGRANDAVDGVLASDPNTAGLEMQVRTCTQVCSIAC